MNGTKLSTMLISCIASAEQVSLISASTGESFDEEVCGKRFGSFSFQRFTLRALKTDSSNFFGANQPLLYLNLIGFFETTSETRILYEKW